MKAKVSFLGKTWEDKKISLEDSIIDAGVSNTDLEKSRFICNRGISRIDIWKWNGVVKCYADETEFLDQNYPVVQIVGINTELPMY